MSARVPERPLLGKAGRVRRHGPYQVVFDGDRVIGVSARVDDLPAGLVIDGHWVPPGVRSGLPAEIAAHLPGCVRADPSPGMGGASEPTFTCGRTIVRPAGPKGWVWIEIGVIDD